MNKKQISYSTFCEKPSCVGAPPCDQNDNTDMTENITFPQRRCRAVKVNNITDASIHFFSQSLNVWFCTAEFTNFTLFFGDVYRT